MIPYGRQNINEDDIEAVVATLRSGLITQGPKIAEFEKIVADYVGAKYAVAVMNGTAALHLAYLAAGIGPGDEVITTPNTFAATTNMLLAVGAKPVFCDIRADTNNLDETKLESFITPKTKAIIPVHFAGHPCAMDEIFAIAKKNNLIVIEDACHALGAAYKGKKVGNLESAMTIFSFHPVKSITTGEGGMVVTNDEKLYQKVKLLRSHGIVKNQDGFNVMSELGYNYRITDIQCALGVSQMKRLDEFVKQRHQVVQWYSVALKNIQDIILPLELTNNISAWHLYLIRVRDIKQRMGLYNYLVKNGVGVNFHYPMVYRHPYYQQLGFADVKLAQADLYHETAITLPLHTLLKPEDITTISSLITSYFKNL